MFDGRAGVFCVMILVFIFTIWGVNLLKYGPMTVVPPDVAATPDAGGDNVQSEGEPINLPPSPSPPSITDQGRPPTSSPNAPQPVPMRRNT